MKKKIFLVIFIFCLMFLFSPSQAWAAKKRVQRGSGGTIVKRTYTRGARALIRFRPDRRGLIISFTSLGNAVSASYTLTYNSNGIPQGAGGTARPETAGEERQLLFGTCSGGVCTYHTNITNARLVIDSKLPSGLIIRKPYRIRV